MLPPKFRNKAACPCLRLLFNITPEIKAGVIRQREEDIKGTQIGKEELQLSLFGDHIFVYKENL